MEEAQYYALLSRASHGSFTRHEMQWEVSLTEGWNMILAGGIMYGGCYMWPDPRLSQAGRQMLAVEALQAKLRSEGIKGYIDL